MNIYFENTPRKSSQWTMLEAGDNWRSLSRVRESIFHLRYKQDLNMSPEIFRRNGRLFLRVSKEEGILRHLVKSHTIYGLKNFKWNLIRQSSFKDGLDFFVLHKIFCVKDNRLCIAISLHCLLLFKIICVLLANYFMVTNRHIYDF